MGKIFNILFRGYCPSKAKATWISSSPYKDGKFRITNHAFQQMNKRKVSVGELHTNLHTKAIKTKIVIDNYGRPSYKRISKNFVVSAINPKINNVNSVWKIDKKRYNNYARIGKKHGK